ncbi:hypothetical protein [Halocatena marina]|uniref:Uncharacterized protein n=1 Tax=Halocatena marina TaxID=2934937 RepID=A0ABD5YRH0_9EURY|nr:hypothetical protein [Halocatena marina]
MPADKKERVIEIHADASSDSMVVSGIHGESTPKAVEEAKRAERAGAEALMLAREATVPMLIAPIARRTVRRSDVIMIH